MKVMILGATGMLGSEMVKVTHGLRNHVIPMAHADLNIADYSKVKSALEKHSPDMVINSAGIVKGRIADDELFYLVNGEAPVKIAQICDDLNIKFIQVSTNCVFKGDRIHYEADKLDANDVYGKSKAAGEVRGKHLTIRCSFIGIGKYGLLSWLMQQKGKVDGYKNVLWNGMVARYMAQNIFDLAAKDVRGIVHVFGQNSTKYDVLASANKHFNLGLDVIPVDEPIEDCRLGTLTNYHYYVPPIEEQIKELIREDRVSDL